MKNEEAGRQGLTPLSPRAKRTRGQTRTNNLRLALQIIYDKAPTSRAEIARASHLTPATASDLVDELLSLDLVARVGTGPSAGGKPPTLFAPNPRGREIMALDISSRVFKGALVDLGGKVIVTAETVGDVGDDALTVVLDLAEELSRSASSPILGVGVGSPGVVDEFGLVSSANLHWKDAKLTAALGDVTDAPVHIINDAQAAALHEFSETDQESNSLILVRVGSGIGTGYILDGHLYRGENGATGEIGHVRLDNDGRLCSCGNRGCLETKASMTALLEMAGGEGEVSRARIEEVADDADSQNAIATAAIELGRVLAPVVAALAIREVIIWGEATALGDEYRLAVEEEIKLRVLSVKSDHIAVRYAKGGGDAVLRGAAGLVLSSELGVVW